MGPKNASLAARSLRRGSSDVDPRITELFARGHIDVGNQGSRWQHRREQRRGAKSGQPTTHFRVPWMAQPRSARLRRHIQGLIRRRAEARKRSLQVSSLQLAISLAVLLKIHSLGCTAGSALLWA